MHQATLRVEHKLCCSVHLTYANSTTHPSVSLLGKGMPYIQCAFFQQDRAPCHTAQIELAWKMLAATCYPGFQFIHFNPIEQVQNVLEQLAPSAMALPHNFGLKGPELLECECQLALGDLQSSAFAGDLAGRCGAN